jgi:hypothetical protein
MREEYIFDIPFPVFLAGSRLMGIERKDSDWDYVAQYTLFRKNCLIELGWKDIASQSPRYKNKRREYKSQNTVCVFEKWINEKIIQVSLKDDVELELCVYSFIDDEDKKEWRKLTDKNEDEERAVVWTTWIRTVRELTTKRKVRLLKNVRSK